MVAQPVAQMECLGAPRVRLFAAVAVANKKVRVDQQTAAWEPAKVTRAAGYFYIFRLFSPVKMPGLTKIAANLTAHRFFPHDSSGEGIFKKFQPGPALQLVACG